MTREVEPVTDAPPCESCARQWVCSQAPLACHDYWDWVKLRDGLRRNRSRLKALMTPEERRLPRASIYRQIYRLQDIQR